MEPHCTILTILSLLFAIVFRTLGDKHAAATALNYFAYNFTKIHRTLRKSPAIAAGVADRLWIVEDLVALWEAYEPVEGGKNGVNGHGLLAVV
jgi:hypothetical protein